MHKKKTTKYKCVRNKSRSIHLQVPKSKLDGNRIINMDILKASIMEMSTHSAIRSEAYQVVSEGKSPIILESERRNGLSVILEARCNGCNKRFIIDNSPGMETNKGLRKEINVKAVWGSMVTGGGCSFMNELLGTMSIPDLDERKYTELETIIGVWWQRELM